MARADWDEGPVSQFERAPAHRERLEQLLESGRAYRSDATAETVKEFKEANPGRGFRGEPSDDPEAAIRLRVPDEGTTVVEDLIRGPISFENAHQDDLVIARSDGSVLYNFAVAVDDAEMGITDVIRGDDHISNTPKQLLVLEALGFPAPRYAHLPLLHGPDGKKLSKRHGAASVQELREAGYLPAAVRNYLALLGWGTTDDTTLMSTEELRRALRHLARRPLRRRLRRAEAALGQRPVHARGAARRVRGDARRPPGPHRPGRCSGVRRGDAGGATRGLRDRPGEGPGRDRDLASDRLPVHRAGARRGIVEEGDEAVRRRAAAPPGSRRSRRSTTTPGPPRGSRPRCGS